MSQKIKITTEFIGIGCNKVAQVAAWAKNGLVAFGANNFVALYYPTNPEARGVVVTLGGHTACVNCVDFINRGDEKEQTNVAIVSGSADRTARIWKKTSAGKYVSSAVLLGHSGSINTLGVVRARSILTERDIVATGSADGTIKIWERTIENETEDKVECLQTIDCGTKYPLALAITYLPNTQAAGGTERRVVLYITIDGKFVESISLQGHENWIRSLSFASAASSISVSNESPKNAYAIHDGDLLLASASQDKYVRLWKIARIGEEMNDEDKGTTEKGGDYVKENDSGMLTDDIISALRGSTISDDKVQLSTRAHIIEVEVSRQEDETKRRQRYSIMFEALLMGHDDWVYSVDWQPACFVKDATNNLVYHQPLCLLTSSSDKSMMIWKPEPDTGIWVNSVRVGEIGGYALGLYGGLFAPDGKHILAHGHTGAFHLWKMITENEDNQHWRPQISISGHFKAVQSITWDPLCRFLVSVSLDQTARLYAPWRRNTDEGKQLMTWHEIARPQIHGYDIQCISFVDEWKYVSGSDEKVIRVFSAPKTFVESLSKLTNSLSTSKDASSRPIGANLPALGLSNKAVFESDIAKLGENEEFLNGQSYAHPSATPSSLTEAMERPPFEEHLLQHTLWPEIYKLYGHGYELISVASSHCGKIIASSCKATTPEHAVIRLFDTATWKEIPNPLQAHSLTVTQIQFSHNDRYLLTVSRDRMWSLFERCEAVPPYKLVTKNKAHARIIWDCSWSHDDLLFATGSRDKSVKIWRQVENKDSSSWSQVTTLKFAEAVTALDFAGCLTHGCYILAIGLENGDILLYQSKLSDAAKWTYLHAIEKYLSHISTVTRLVWRKPQNNDVGTLQIASCATDHSVRLFNVMYEQ
ncbi:9871_t:CDS:10 [Paraglomus occultum]|uniref:Elongator complex protein 2 n=1 Tax=Paraglomus occultum TaxID=144539 RepID=A0A9N9G427_9GLOM|nr:9871_t:CDS:10 [Paraglomus occultum]